ncbi:hypothetical protein BDE02_10G170400 [Populus trichocarpa]|nr:hypothetical protein BDE02_10G170400 [Populus trichocarpa]
MMWIFVTFYFSCLHDQDGGNQRLYQRCLKETCLKKKEPFHSRVFFLLAKGRTEDLIFQHEEFYLVGYDCASRALQSSGLTRSRPYASILLSSIMVLA